MLFPAAAACSAATPKACVANMESSTGRATAAPRPLSIVRRDNSPELAKVRSAARSAAVIWFIGMAIVSISQLGIEPLDTIHPRCKILARVANCEDDDFFRNNLIVDDVAKPFKKGSADFSVQRIQLPKRKGTGVSLDNREGRVNPFDQVA